MRLLFRWIRLAGLALVLLALLGAAWIAKDGLTDQIWPADVVVVFGNRVDPDGSPSIWLKARLDKALELYQDGVARNFIVSGGVGKEGFDEASVMRSYLIAQGVPETLVWLDNGGNTTRLTAQKAAEVMRQQGWHNVILVSQFYHIPRAILAFEQAGVVSVGSAHSDGFFIQDIPSLARELIAYPVYWLQGR